MLRDSNRLFMFSFRFFLFFVPTIEIGEDFLSLGEF